MDNDDDGHDRHTVMTIPHMTLSVRWIRKRKVGAIFEKIFTWKSGFNNLVD